MSRPLSFIILFCFIPSLNLTHYKGFVPNTQVKAVKNMKKYHKTGYSLASALSSASRSSCVVDQLVAKRTAV